MMKKKIRIFAIYTYFFPVFTGDGKTILNLASTLSGKVEISVLTPRHTSSPLFEQMGKLQVIRVPVFGPKRLKAILFSLSLIPLLLISWTKYDIIMCTDILTSMVVNLYSKVLRKPVIFRTTIMGSSEPGAIKKQRFGNLKLRFYRMADAVVSINPLITLDLLKNGIPEYKAKEIPDGIDIERFSPASREEKFALKQKYEIPLYYVVVSFVGGIIKRKGVDLLVEAWRDVVRQCPRSLLLLIGPPYPDHPTEGKFYRELLEFVERESLESSIKFVGEVQDVRDYLKISDIFVFPTKREAMPNALLEAMATGLSCVVAPFIGFCDYFGESGKELIRVNHEPKQISEALINLIQNPEIREEIGKQARKRAEEKFSIEKMGEEHVTLFKELLHIEITA